MALILRYVDLHVVGFVSVYGMAASCRPAAVASGGNLRCVKIKQEKEKGKGKRKEKAKKKRK